MTSSPLEIDVIDEHQGNGVNHETLNQMDTVGGNENNDTDIQQHAIQQELEHENALQQRIEIINAPETRKSVRDRRIPDKLKDYQYKLPPSNMTDHDDLSPSFSAYKLDDSDSYSEEYIAPFNNVIKMTEPVTFTKAASQEGWVDAMNELRAMEETGTWEFCDLPPDKKVIDSKWCIE